MIVYMITNLINGKIYIGQSKYKNSKYFGSGKLIKKAINKYGINNFKKDIICECNNREELDEKEIFYIKKFNSIIPNGYNISRGGGREHHNDDTSEKISNSVKGKKHSEETKLKIGLSSKGKTYEQRYGYDKALELKKIRRMKMKENNPMKNGHTEEDKIKISNAMKGHKKYPNQINKVKKLFTGKSKDILHKKNISLSKISVTIKIINDIRYDFNNNMSYKDLSLKYKLKYNKIWKICNYKYYFES